MILLVSTDITEYRYAVLAFNCSLSPLYAVSY